MPLYKNYCVTSWIDNKLLSFRAKGYLITMFGVLAVSPDGLLTRLIDADSLTIIFWRGLLFGLTGLAIVLLRYRTNSLQLLLEMSWPDYIVMFTYMVGNILFIYSITHTSVANTLFMVSTTPIWAALIGWVFLGERVPGRTWFAIFMVIIGILVIAQGSKLGAQSWKGDIAGLIAACALAAQFSTIRLVRKRDMFPAMAFGGIFTALLVSPWIEPGLTSNQDMFFLMLMGVVMLPIATKLLILGPRYLPAPEVGLMMLLETIVGPIWVWFVLKENPGFYSIVGGTIVLLTLAINSFLSLRMAGRVRTNC